MAMSIVSARQATVSVALVCTLVAATVPSLGQPRDRQSEPPIAEIISPKDGDRVPQEGDPPCPERAPCTKIFVEGRVGKGYWPFLAVAPLPAAPRIWIQPPITAVKRDGRFTGMIYLGTERVGAGHKYNVFIFAHKNRNRFSEGEVLMGVPDDVVASDPVTVLRTR
jgi:hypothetical protein